MKRPHSVRGDEFYLRAFSRLSTERQFNHGFGPIPWSAIDRYGTRAGLHPAMHEVFVDVIMLMDSAYREQAKEQNRKQDEQDAKDAKAAAGQKAGKR